jgi:UDP-N-acetylmuramate dehydrogenase
VRSKRDLPSLAQQRGLAAGLSLEEPLSKHTSYRIGGPAQFLATVENVDHLCSWVELARELEQPLLVMGEGTNLLVADRGYRGLVILNRCRDFVMEPASHQVRAEAGVSLAHLARHTAENGSGGLEWAIGIPGTVGGAIVNNAGAYDGDIAGVIRRVRILDRCGEIRDLEPGDLELGYRTSRFRGAASEEEIILSADLQLIREESALLRRRMDEYAARRRKAQPGGRSAGSVFKNPPGLKAGQLIDEAGLRGRRIGDAQISPKHANYIINMGSARAEDVLRLINEAQERVQRLCGIDLELEIELVGDWQKAHIN